MVRLAVRLVAVDPDDHRFAGVDLRGPLRRRFLDSLLGQPLRDRLGHPAAPLDFLDQRPRTLFQLASQFLDVPASAERVGDGRHAAFLGEDQLRVAGNARGEIRRQRDRFVIAVGVQRLGAAEHRRKRLDRGADDVVVRVLLGQAHARCLAVGAKHLRPVGLRAKLGHDPVPECPRGAQLRHLHEQVHSDSEEEAQPSREGVDLQPLRHRRADIFHTVGERVSELLHRRRSGLVHVIAADRDRVELRHLRRAISDHVGDDPHARLGRIDVGVADRELFQDVVLDRARQLGVRDSLLLSGDDEEGHDRKNRAVHRHADRHLVERDSVEEQFHVLDGIDRDSRHPHVAGNARIVAVVAAVCGEVEGDRQALLPRLQIAAVESVRLLRCREAGVLADGPRPARIHRCIGTAREGRLARIARVDALSIVRPVNDLQVDPFKCLAADLVTHRRSP